MIADIPGILGKIGLLSVNQYRAVTEIIVDGEVRKTYDPPVNINCAVLPMNGQELKNTPEGEYTAEDKIVLAESSSPIKVGDAVIYAGSAFEIKNLVDLGSIVNLRKYTAKRIATGDALVADAGPVTYNAGWDEFVETFENGLLDQ